VDFVCLFCFCSCFYSFYFDIFLQQTGLLTTSFEGKSAVQFPKLTSNVGRGMFLFGSIATVYSGAKCVAEGLCGEKHPIASG
jgi:hypothetical protein